jgi:hypothetical protein
MKMNLHEYGLLIAVSLPVLVIAAMQVLLFIGGERATLLLPSLKHFESMPAIQEPGAVAEGKDDEAVIVPLIVVQPEALDRYVAVRDEMERKAA